MGRTAAGVRGVTLEGPEDEVIGMICVSPEDESTTIMVVSEKGYGKRTEVNDYRITGRGGKGVKTISITEKTGSLVGIKAVTEEDGLMIINRSGMTIRMGLEKVRFMGRATQGVKLINIKGEDAIASVAKVPREDEEEEVLEGETENTENSVENEENVDTSANNEEANEENNNDEE